MEDDFRRLTRTELTYLSTLITPDTNQAFNGVRRYINKTRPQFEALIQNLDLVQLITLVGYLRIVVDEVNPHIHNFIYNKLTLMREITRELYYIRRQEAVELLRFQEQQEQMNQEEIRQMEENERQLQEAREYERLNDLTPTEDMHLSEGTHVSSVHDSDFEGAGLNIINKQIQELIKQLEKMKKIK